MEVTDELVDKLARLSKLSFEGEGKQAIKKDLNQVLEFIDKLNELDTDGVEPLVYMTNEENVLRIDEAKETITKGEVLKNAPEKDSDYFKVPKVLKKG